MRHVEILPYFGTAVDALHAFCVKALLAGENLRAVTMNNVSAAGSISVFRMIMKACFAARITILRIRRLPVLALVTCSQLAVGLVRIDPTCTLPRNPYQYPRHFKWPRKAIRLSGSSSAAMLSVPDDLQTCTDA